MNFIPIALKIVQVEFVLVETVIVGDYFLYHLLRHCASLNYTLWIKIRTKGKMLSDFGVVISMHRIISSSDFDKLFFLLAILIFAIDSHKIIQSCNPTILFEIKGWSVCKFRHRTLLVIEEKVDKLSLFVILLFSSLYKNLPNY